MTSSSPKVVLNVGSGPPDPLRLHPAFQGGDWREVRVDIDPLARPDVLSSVVGLGNHIAPESVDAIWCSHTLEHLDSHDLLPALRACYNVLAPTGFALITSPEVGSIARLILEKGLGAIAYVSPAGPITPLDMLYGHGASIRSGHHFMAHRTGFTVETFGVLAIQAGFQEAKVVPGEGFDLWAILTMPLSDPETVFACFRNTNIERLFAAEYQATAVPA